MIIICDIYLRSVLHRYLLTCCLYVYIYLYIFQYNFKLCSSLIICSSPGSICEPNDPSIDIYVKTKTSLVYLISNIMLERKLNSIILHFIINKLVTILIIKCISGNNLKACTFVYNFYELQYLLYSLLSYLFSILIKNDYQTFVFEILINFSLQLLF